MFESFVSPFSKSPMTRRGLFDVFCHVRSYASSAQERATRSRSLGPAVRNLVEQYQIQPGQLHASGPKGFMLKGDVLNFIKEQNLKPAVLKAALPSAQPSVKQKSTVPVGTPGPKNSRGQVKYFDLSLSPEAKNSASESLRGKIEIPHAYMYANCTIDEALKLFSGKKGLESVTLTDVIVRAVVTCAQRLRIGGTSDDKVGNLDLAVQSYDNGEMSSRILHKANTLGVKDIAKKMKENSVAGSSDVAKVSFRVVSLIGSRLQQITEILTPTQNWVISVGDAMVRIDAKTKATSKIVTLALSYNAAVIPEDQAGKFLEEVKKSIERPVLILVGRT